MTGVRGSSIDMNAMRAQGITITGTGGGGESSAPPRGAGARSPYPTFSARHILLSIWYGMSRLWIAVMPGLEPASKSRALTFRTGRTLPSNQPGARARKSSRISAVSRGN